MKALRVLRGSNFGLGRVGVRHAFDKPREKDSDANENSQYQLRKLRQKPKFVQPNVRFAREAFDVPPNLPLVPANLGPESKRIRVSALNKKDATFAFPLGDQEILEHSEDSTPYIPPNAKVALDSFLRKVRSDHQEERVVVEKTAAVLPTPDELGRVYSTGSRKRATARVWLSPGNGNFTINKLPHVDYFRQQTDYVRTTLQPFTATSTEGQYDVWCTVSGGGLSAQAEAIQHGIARALQGFDESHRSLLKPAGFLTRDPREVERKKAGRAKARKRYRWKKR